MSRMSKPTKTEINRDVMLEVAEEIMAIIVNNDVPMVVDGGITVPVKYEDGGYKQKPIRGGWEFYVQSLYLSAKDAPIFCMTTPDYPDLISESDNPPHWVIAEFNVKHMDDAFPLLLTELAAHIEVKDTFAETVMYHYNRKVAATKLDMETSEDKLRALPTFGMF